MAHDGTVARTQGASRERDGLEERKDAGGQYHNIETLDQVTHLDANTSIGRRKSEVVKRDTLPQVADVITKVACIGRERADAKRGVLGKRSREGPYDVKLKLIA